MSEGTHKPVDLKADMEQLHEALENAATLPTDEELRSDFWAGKYVELALVVRKRLRRMMENGGLEGSVPQSSTVRTYIDSQGNKQVWPARTTTPVDLQSEGFCVIRRSKSGGFWEQEGPCQTVEHYAKETAEAMARENPDLETKVVKALRTDLVSYHWDDPV